MKSCILFLAATLASLNFARGSLMSIMSDCCGRGTSFARAGVGRNCDDVETMPDIAPEDQAACMVVMKACCSHSVRPVLCNQGIDHRQNVGSCRTLSNDTCFSASRECCECCDLGISAFHAGLPCDAMTTDSNCDDAFSECCRAASMNNDENECSRYANHRLCMEQCVNLIGSYACECNEGNRLLEDEITCVAAGGTSESTTRPSPPRYLTCDQAPCQHECRQQGREYQCSCRRGYELMSDGYSCIDIDECAFRDRVVCSYAERCLNTIGSFNCISDVVCRNGLRYDPTRQYCVDINECEETPDICDAESTCDNTYGGYRCRQARCPAGYFYDRQMCRDKDECSLGTHDCQDGFRCDNLEGSFTCTRIIPCGTGYTINGVTQACVDIDECSQRSHDCQRSERCVNVRGSYRCEPCPLGFEADSYTNQCTQDIDECRSESTHTCEEGKRCQNNYGSYDCISVCIQGFEFNRALGACMDIDECRRGLAGCGTHEICQNLNGSFSCGCRRGFRLQGSRCVDINECSEGTSMCLDHQRCYNLPGQYQCRNVCPPGYRFNRINSACEDIDECAEGTQQCAENQQCINQPGSYVCQCPPGHQANRQRGTCEDVNECEMGLCRGGCENVPGSYICSCPEGYVLTENKVTCRDIDECSLNMDTCSDSQYCFNTRGDYRCETIECPRYYQLHTSNKLQCLKRCPTGAEDCENNAINSTITHTFLALPSIERLTNPIRLLTIGLPNYRSLYGGTRQMYFNLVRGNEDNYFTISRLYPRGMPTGYLSLRKPIQGPYETDLELEIVTEFNNPITLRTEVIRSSRLLIHIVVSEYIH